MNKDAVNISVCLSLGHCFCEETQGEKPLGEKTWLVVPYDWSSLKEVRKGTHAGQEAGAVQRPWGLIWLTPCSFAQPAPYRTQSHHPRYGLTPPSITARQLYLQGHFPSWGSLLSDDSSLYQSGIKLARTVSKSFCVHPAFVFIFFFWLSIESQWNSGEWYLMTRNG